MKTALMIMVLCGLVLGCGMTEGSLYQIAKDFSLQDVNNKTVRLSDYGGKIVILNFFATWCPPCRAEIPDFVELVKGYGDKGLVIIGVSVDNAGVEAVKTFATSMGINYPVLLDDGIVSNDYGPIASIPTTFIIDKQGNIVNKIVGSRSKAQLEALIKPLLPDAFRN